MIALISNRNYSFSSSKLVTVILAAELPLLLTKFILYKNKFAELLVIEIGPLFSDKIFRFDLRTIPVAAAIVMDVSWLVELGLNKGMSSI